MWLPQLRTFAADFRVAAPDLPGHGELAALPFTFDAAVGELMEREWLDQSAERTEDKTMRLFPLALADVAEEQRRAGLQTGPLGAAFAGMAGRKWSALLAEFPGPVLILNGEHDSMARKHEARFAAGTKRARVETIAGAGHACSLEQPEAFDQALREFLRTVGPPWSGTAVHRASRAGV